MAGLEPGRERCAAGLHRGPGCVSHIFRYMTRRGERYVSFECIVAQASKSTSSTVLEAPVEGRTYVVSQTICYQYHVTIHDTTRFGSTRPFSPQASASQESSEAGMVLLSYESSLGRHAPMARTHAPRYVKPTRHVAPFLRPARGPRGGCGCETTHPHTWKRHRGGRPRHSGY